MTSDELMALITATMQENHQRWAKRVRIELEDGEVIDLLVPRALNTRQPLPSDVIDGVRPDLAQAIFEQLADAVKRHTREEMAQALDGQFSESAVHKALWSLRAAGKLTNCRDSYGAGFGLPEWQ